MGFNKNILKSPASMTVYYYDPIPSVEKAKSIVEAVKRSGNFPFVLEKNKDGKYVLVNGFEEYAAFIKIQPDGLVSAKCEPARSEVEQLLQIVKNTFLLPKTSWLFKNKYMTKLTKEYYLSPEKIAQLTMIPVAILRSSLYNPKIPIHIYREAKDEGAKSLLELIKNSIVIPAEMKPILYERAVLPEKEKHCLSTEKFFLMEKFCSSCYFPESVLTNLERLEWFIDDLLTTNFKLSTHWNQILMQFIKESRLH